MLNFKNGLARMGAMQGGGAMRMMLCSPSVIRSFASQNKPDSQGGDNTQKPNQYTANTKAKRYVDPPIKTEEPYIHKVNYNFEEHTKYTRTLQQELAKKAKQELDISQGLIRKIPRRHRRLYDRPKYDLDITNYEAWRCFDRPMYKNGDHSLPVVCKIIVAPKILRKVFGEGHLPTRNKAATREYDFEDVNYDSYLLYDYRATTDFWGKNKEGYDYENQESIDPKRRKVKWPSNEEFWNSTEDHMFRLNCSPYADFRKFRKWFLTQVEQYKDADKSFEERVIEKHGKPELYDDYNKDYATDKGPAVFLYTREFFQTDKKEKLDPKNPYNQKIKPAQALGDEYLIKKKEQSV